MALERSDLSRYPSKYGSSRWVTAMQYLAELMCERQARRQKRVLGFGFWKSPEWAKVYAGQLAAIDRLLDHLDPKVEVLVEPPPLTPTGRPTKKKPKWVGVRTGAGVRAISRFLRSPRGKDVYSLAGLWLVPLVEAALRDLGEAADAQEEAAGPPVPPQPPRPAFYATKSAKRILLEAE